MIRSLTPVWLSDWWLLCETLPARIVQPLRGFEYRLSWFSTTVQNAWFGLLQCFNDRYMYAVSGLPQQYFFILFIAYTTLVLKFSNFSQVDEGDWILTTLDQFLKKSMLAIKKKDIAGTMFFISHVFFCFGDWQTYFVIMRDFHLMLI